MGVKSSLADAMLAERDAINRCHYAFTTGGDCRKALVDLHLASAKRMVGANLPAHSR